MQNIVRTAGLAVLVLVSLLAAGCAGPAPNYAPSIDNVEALKKSGGESARIGTFTVDANLPGAKSIGLRANTMVSPVGSHFGDYLGFALRQDLELARLYNAQSGIEISGALLKNLVDANGFSIGNGQIEARFVVKRAGQVRYDKVRGVTHQWESSFAGAVAIPQASSNYPVMVQKLIGSLVSDPDFVNSLRN